MVNYTYPVFIIIVTLFFFDLSFLGNLAYNSALVLIGLIVVDYGTAQLGPKYFLRIERQLALTEFFRPNIILNIIFLRIINLFLFTLICVTLKLTIYSELNIYLILTVVSVSVFNLNFYYHGIMRPDIIATINIISQLTSMLTFSVLIYARIEPLIYFGPFLPQMIFSVISLRLLIKSQILFSRPHNYRRILIYRLYRASLPSFIARATSNGQSAFTVIVVTIFLGTDFTGYYSVFEKVVSGIASVGSFSVYSRYRNVLAHKGSKFALSRSDVFLILVIATLFFSYAVIALLLIKLYPEFLGFTIMNIALISLPILTNPFGIMNNYVLLIAGKHKLNIGFKISFATLNILSLLLGVIIFGNHGIAIMFIVIFLGSLIETIICRTKNLYHS